MFSKGLTRRRSKLPTPQGEAENGFVDRQTEKCVSGSLQRSEDSKRKLAPLACGLSRAACDA
jgi:hypothetical protein